MTAPATAEGWTAGPWNFERDEREDGHVIRMGEAIDSPWNYPSEQVVRYNHGLYANDEDNCEQFAIAEANARLIAAAPELFEALARAEARDEERRPYEDVEMCADDGDADSKDELWRRQQQRAALAKARGQ